MSELTLRSQSCDVCGVGVTVNCDHFVTLGGFYCPVPALGVGMFLELIFYLNFLSQLCNEKLGNVFFFHELKL